MFSQCSYQKGIKSCFGRESTNKNKIFAVVLVVSGLFPVVLISLSLAGCQVQAATAQDPCNPTFMMGIDRPNADFQQECADKNNALIQEVQQQEQAKEQAAAEAQQAIIDQENEVQAESEAKKDEQNPPPALTEYMTDIAPDLAAIQLANEARSCSLRTNTWFAVVENGYNQDIAKENQKVPLDAGETKAASDVTAQTTSPGSNVDCQALSTDPRLATLDQWEQQQLSALQLQESLAFP